MADFVTKRCVSCGLEFGIPEPYYADRRRGGETWYCPNGHGMVSKPEPKVDPEKRIKELEEELEAAEAKIEELSRELDVWRPSSAAPKEKSAG